MAEYAKLSFSEIEKKAKDNETILDNLTLTDQMLFLCLRGLYHDFQRGNIDPQCAALEKRKIKTQYEKQCDLDKMDAKIRGNICENRRKAMFFKEELAKGLEENKPVEFMLKTALYCIGALTDDELFINGALEAYKQYLPEADG